MTPRLLLSVLLLLSACATPPKSQQFDPDWAYRPEARALHIAICAGVPIVLNEILNWLFPRWSKFERVTLSVLPPYLVMENKEYHHDEAASLSDHKANSYGALAALGYLTLKENLFNEGVRDAEARE